MSRVPAIATDRLSRESDNLVIQCDLASSASGLAHKRLQISLKTAVHPCESIHTDFLLQFAKPCSGWRYAEKQ